MGLACGHVTLLPPYFDTFLVEPLGQPVGSGDEFRSLVAQGFTYPSHQVRVPYLLPTIHVEPNQGLLLLAFAFDAAVLVAAENGLVVAVKVPGYVLIHRSHTELVKRQRLTFNDGVRLLHDTVEQWIVKWSPEVEDIGRAVPERLQLTAQATASQFFYLLK